MGDYDRVWVGLVLTQNQQSPVLEIPASPDPNSWRQVDTLSYPVLTFTAHITVWDQS